MYHPTSFDLMSFPANAPCIRSTILDSKTMSDRNHKPAIPIDYGAPRKISPALGAWCNLRKYFNFYDGY
jgi:hypothetical protein